MWRRVLVDLMIIMCVGIFSGIIVNELRADGIPLLPTYMDSSFHREMDLNAFKGAKCKNPRCLIFDARPHEFYEKDHLMGAVNFPPVQFDFFHGLYLADVPPDAPIFVYGRTISRACDRELAYLLSLKGHKNVTVIF
ncbi:MAG: rhodanese-like domain-containing protein [Thermodesulfobacteriota bacterium]|nr:rhodanese-like domain-containing protein [Thermodesulfobacteriota bacterium]